MTDITVNLGPDDDFYSGNDDYNETVNGLAGDDQILGFAGDDTLNGNGGNDTLVGGNGFDTLRGGDGDDVLNGGGGPSVFLTDEHPSDIIIGGAGIDRLIVDYHGFIINGDSNHPAAVTMDISVGGAGEVQVSGLRGENFTGIETLRFEGPDGNDSVTGGAFADIIDGNGGDDVLRGKGGDDAIGDSSGLLNADGGAGNDTFTLHRDNDTLDDTINGLSGKFLLDGAAQGKFVNFENLMAFGGSGNDTIVAPDGINTLFGNTGDDTLIGGSGIDDLIGGGDNDTLKGGAGDDTIQGNSGHNNLQGGDGNDTIKSGGVDQVAGGAGDDTVYFHTSLETAGSAYNGGADQDTFVFELSSTAAVDLTGVAITGFETFQDDGYILSFDYQVKMTTAQFAQFTSIQLGTSDLTVIYLADRADAKLPANAAVRGVHLASGGQHFDASTEVTGYASIYGGNGDDVVIGRTGAGFNFVAQLGSGNDTFDGHASNDIVLGEAGNDTLNGGDGNDTLTGGAGADLLTPGTGADKLVYHAASESTGSAFDTIAGFDFAADKIDLPFAVSGVAAAVKHGTLSDSGFNAQMTGALDAAHLGVHQAVLFTPDGGSFAGKTFLVVDANGTAGYQAGADYVFLLDHPVHAGQLDTTDFT